MGVFRTWLRGLLGASGVTLLVPVGLLAALAVAATVGGNGLGSVGQLIGGPQIPRAQRADASVDEGSLPSVPRRSTHARATTPRTATTGRAATTAASATTRRAATSPARRGSTPSTKAPSKATTTTTAKATVPASPTTGAATPAPAPTTTATQPTETNPVRVITKAVTGAVSQVPVVGKPVADVVDSVVDLIAPPPKSGS